MTTSGVYDFSLTLNQLIIEAFDEIKIGADGETLSGDMQERATRTLNRMIKDWEQMGINLWRYTEGTLFMQVGQAEYPFDTAKLANTYFETSLSVDAAALATSITVEDDSNMVVGDQIGIILDSNDLQWTTIASLPGANVVNLNDALTDAANSGAAVRNYRDTFIPASRVLDVRRRETDDYEIPIVFESRKDYFNLPNKEQLGTPIQAYYQRGRDFGTMFLWSSPSSSVPVINFTYERKMEIMTDMDETLDFPQEWQNAVIMNLAYRLIPKYGASAEVTADIKLRADESFSLASNYDSAPYPITMDMQEYG